MGHVSHKEIRALSKKGALYGSNEYIPFNTKEEAEEFLAAREKEELEKKD